MNDNGYRRISIHGKRYYAHRLAFLYMNGSLPESDTDHINHCRDDNRWDNLRRVTREENLKNQTIRTDNTSGVVGVRWFKRDGNWQARINHKGKEIHLGYFTEKGVAIQARLAAEIKYGFHPNHGAELE
jgi:hypothetical protein